MTRQQCQQVGRLSAQARGFVPWIPRIITPRYCLLSETEYMAGLALLDGYRKGSRRKNQAIAAEVNRVYHENQPIRNGAAISSQFGRIGDEVTYLANLKTERERVVIVDEEIETINKPQA